MTETKPEELKEAYKREKDPRVRARMAAVNAVCILDCSISDTAELLMQSPNRVTHRAGRLGGAA